MCAFGDTSTVIPTGAGHVESLRQTFAMFESNDVCNVGDYAGRIVWDATDQVARVITAKLYSFLSRAKRKTSHTNFSNSPVLHVTCETSSNNGQTSLSQDFSLVPRGQTNPNLVFVQFGAADIMLLKHPQSNDTR